MFNPHRLVGYVSPGLVTGAASGIGRAVVEALINAGVTRIVLADINTAGMETLAASLKEKSADINTLIVRVDTSSEEDVQRMVKEAVDEFGEIHYCVNAAGVTSNPRVKTDQLPLEAWDRVMNINLRGVWLCQKAEITQMLKQEAGLKTPTGAPPQRGSIVNISSVLGRIAHPTNGSYAAAKAGILGMTRTDAIAYAEDGIRVNAVCPGFIKTPLIQEAIDAGANYDSLVKSVPAGRSGTPEEVAQLVVFLASEISSYLTGEDVAIDGGLLHGVR